MAKKLNIHSIKASQNAQPEAAKAAEQNAQPVQEATAQPEAAPSQNAEAETIGKKKPLAKFTEEEKAAVRADHAAGKSLNWMGAKYNCYRDTLKKIIGIAIAPSRNGGQPKPAARAPMTPRYAAFIAALIKQDHGIDIRPDQAAAADLILGDLDALNERRKAMVAAIDASIAAKVKELKDLEFSFPPKDANAQPVQ